MARVGIKILKLFARDHTAPDRTADFQGDFIAETITCAPLSDVHFQVDTRKVHQFLKTQELPSG